MTSDIDYKTKFNDFIISNLEYYQTIISNLNKQRDDAISNNESIFYNDIIKQHKELVRSTILNDITKRLDIPIDYAIIYLDDILYVFTDNNYISNR